MRPLILLSLLVAPLALAEPTTQPSHQDFGEGLKLLEADTIDAAKVLATPEKYDGKELRLTGTIAEVCQHSGCWLTLGAEGTKTRLMVKFTCPVEGRLIPEDAAGKTVIVEGKLQVRQIEEEVARHFAEEAGASKEEIEAIKGPQKQVRLASPAARVLVKPTNPS